MIPNLCVLNGEKSIMVFLYSTAIFAIIAGSIIFTEYGKINLPVLSMIIILILSLILVSYLNNRIEILMIYFLAFLFVGIIALTAWKIMHKKNDKNKNLT